MAEMLWFNGGPQLVDESGYKWMEANFLCLVLIEALNAVIFGCNF